MGKRGNTRKKKGMLLAVVMLLCAFLTGCGLLDIRDGGLGMTNPDYNPDDIELEEAQPENPSRKKNQPRVNMRNFRIWESPKKKVRLPGLRRRGKRH